MPSSTRSTLGRSPTAMATASATSAGITDAPRSPDRPRDRRRLALPVLRLAPGRRRLRRRRLHATSIRCSEPWMTSTGSRMRRGQRGYGSSSIWCPTTARTATRGSKPHSPIRIHPSVLATFFGRVAESAASDHPTTGSRSSAARPGSTPPGATGICTSSIARSPTSTGPIRRSPTSSTTSCGSGSIGASTDFASTSHTAW